MFSKREAKLLEASAEETSYGAISHLGSSKPNTKDGTGNSSLIASAPAVLEPSKDSSRPHRHHDQRAVDDSNSPAVNPWRTLITSSCPQPSPRVLVSSNGQTDEQRQIIDEPLNERPASCSSFLGGYENFANKFGKSKLIHVFQALFSLILISAVFVGSLTAVIKSCPASHLLPTFSGITGVVGLLANCFWVSISYNHRRDRQSSVGSKFGFMLFSLTYCCFLLVETCVFGMMSPSFARDSPNFCNKTFYYYFLSKQVATGVFAVLATILYLPRCCCFTGSADDQ